MKCEEEKVSSFFAFFSFFAREDTMTRKTSALCSFEFLIFHFAPSWKKKKKNSQLSLLNQLSCEIWKFSFRLSHP